MPSVLRRFAASAGSSQALTSETRRSYFPDAPDGAHLPDLAVVSYHADPSWRRLSFLSDAGFDPDGSGRRIKGYVVLRP